MTPTTTCLDADTLAAWVDGGLSRSDAAMAEAHVSSCARCQEIAGLIVKTTPVVPVRAPWWRARAAWLVPVAAGVAAVGLWILPPAPKETRPEPAAQVARVEAARDTAAPAAPAIAPPPAEPRQPARGQSLKKEKADRFRTAPKDESPQLRGAAGEERQREARTNKAADTAAAPLAAAPPAVATGQVAAGEMARQSSAAASAKQAVSPDGSLHWRITDRGALERSSDGGATWQGVRVGIAATFTTVQAPAPRTAIVTTTDGRQFRTTDAGTTWQPVAR